MAVKDIWHPSDYSSAAIIAQEAGQEMLSRLDWMTFTPKLILDVGCGTGEISNHLRIKYPQATIISIDNAMNMLTYAAQQTLNSCICADGSQLPLKNQSVDLIIANFLLPWQSDIAIFLREWRRILHQDGVLMFTMLGLDTLKEWQSVFKREDMPYFVDMHDIGDLLLEQGFSDPVLDVCHYTTTYKSETHLLRELRASGMWFPETSELEHDNFDVLEANYEVIHAHAFLATTFESNVPNEINIPLSHLRHQLRNR